MLGASRAEGPALARCVTRSFLMGICCQNMLILYLPMFCLIEFGKRFSCTIVAWRDRASNFEILISFCIQFRASI